MPDGAGKLMVFGIGKLGGAVVDLLAANYPENSYMVVARSAERAALRANLTRYVCSQWGRYPEVTYAEADLMNTDATAELIARYQPDIVFNATTPFPWWLMDAFPDAVRGLTYSAGLGMWCALDCVLPLKLSEALGQLNPTPMYVNGCYPDMVNAFLRDMPTPPALGIGNISNLIPGLTLTFAESLEVPASELTVRLICHHYTSLNAPTVGGCSSAPYYLSVSHDSGELTFTEPDDAPFAQLKSRFSRVRGLEGQGVTICSAATVLGSLLSRSRRRHHVPGPSGLVGGYPIDITEARDIELDLPRGLDLARAVAINKAAQRYDGLEEVCPGSVRLTDRARSALNEIVGLELPTVTKSNVVELAREVLDRLNDRYGFELRL